MTTASYTRPDVTTQSATQYKANIDAMARVFERVSGPFAVHQIETGSPAPDMAVTVDAGALFSNVTLTEVASQTVSGFTTPSAGTHRIDRIVLDTSTGVASRVAGTAVTGSPSATAPAIPSGKIPLAQILLVDSSTYISNTMITDERVLLGSSSSGFMSLLSTQAASSSSSIDFTSTYVNSTYHTYELHWYDVDPATGATDMWLRVSQSASFLAANYTWANSGNTDAGTGLPDEGSSSDSKIKIAKNLNAGGPCSGRLRFHNPAGSTEYKMFNYESANYAGGSENLLSLKGGGAYIGNANAIDGIRILMSSGNIDSGTFKLYGGNS